MNYLIYDIEIKKAILGKNDARIPGIEYCAGWHDHAGMGISCIGAYESATDRTRVFMDDNREEFFEAIDRADLLVGFNNRAFDNAVILEAWSCAVDESKCYDLLVEIWAAAGLGPRFAYPSHAGYGLDACCSVNFGINKTGNGAFAPVHYQRGEIGRLVDYCLNDIAMTKRLFNQVVSIGEIICPKTGGILKVRRP